MAAGWLRHLSNGKVDVFSGGSEPAQNLNAAAVEVMLEVGINISSKQPQLFTTESVKVADVVITMGCGDICPIFPGKRYEDWALDDPAGLGISAVRIIRDEIRGRVEALVRNLTDADK